MSNECCSGSIINIGCFNHCSTVETGLTATINGTYRISLVPGGGYIDLPLLIGNDIEFSGTFFNEDGSTIFKILDPNDNVVTSGGADCFRANMKVGVDLTDVGT